MAPTKGRRSSASTRKRALEEDEDDVFDYEDVQGLSAASPTPVKKGRGAKSRAPEKGKAGVSARRGHDQDGTRAGRKKSGLQARRGAAKHDLLSLSQDEASSSKRQRQSDEGSDSIHIGDLVCIDRLPSSSKKPSLLGKVGKVKAGPSGPAHWMRVEVQGEEVTVNLSHLSYVGSASGAGPELSAPSAPPPHHSASSAPSSSSASSAQTSHLAAAYPGTDHASLKGLKSAAAASPPSAAAIQLLQAAMSLELKALERAAPAHAAAQVGFIKRVVARASATLPAALNLARRRQIQSQAVDREAFLAKEISKLKDAEKQWQVVRQDVQSGVYASSNQAGEGNSEPGDIGADAPDEVQGLPSSEDLSKTCEEAAQELTLRLDQLGTHARRIGGSIVHEAEQAQAKLTKRVKATQFENYPKVGQADEAIRGFLGRP